MIRKATEKKPLFIKIFASIVLSVVIIVVVLSTISYVNIENVMSSQISNANLKSLNQISEEVNSMAKITSTISYQIYNDVTISKLLNFTNLNIYDQSLAMNQVTNYQTIFPMIDSIYVYNGNSDTFYVRSKNINVDAILNKENFFDKQAISIIDAHVNYRQDIPIARRYYDADGTLRSLYYTFITYNQVWSKNNAVIVNVNESFIQSIIDEEQARNESESFILDGQGKIVSDSKNYPMLADMSGKDYIRGIFKNGGKPGYFVSNVNGVKSLVVFTAPDSIGWTYVRVFRWDALFSKITYIKMLILLFSLGILALGVLSAFIISRQLYRPINNLISNVRNLEAEKKDNTILIKQEFLRGMLLGNISQATDLMKKRGELNIGIPISGRLVVILIRIDQFRSFLKRFGHEQRSNIKMTIAKTSSDLLAETVHVEALDTAEDSVAVIIDVSVLQDISIKAILSAKLSAVQAALLDQLGISVSIAVSEVGDGMEMLFELHAQALKVSLHRLFYGQGCIIFAADINAFPSTGYNYPTQKEKLLTDSLMEGKFDDVKKLYSEIIGETSAYQIGVFNLTISHLIFTLNKTINIITSNNSISSASDIGIPITLLSEVETIGEFNSNLFAIFDRLSRSLAEKKTLKHESIVNSINEIIQSKYSDTNLSISTIADVLDVSEAYICRVFKQLTLHTILESIVEVRMSHARELLRKTDLSISLVAEKSGFASQTYFYTAFKSANGVTPSEYRKNVREEPGLDHTQIS